MPKNYMLAIAFVAILVIGVGVIFAVRWTQSIGPATNQMAENEVTVAASPLPSPKSASPASGVSPAIDTTAPIHLTAQGFSPFSVTVKAGQSVVFINDTANSMRVVSDPHPTHINYPGFDEVKGVAQGGSYKFTFDKKGSWGYHNHLNPSQTGSIIVQ